MRINWAGIGLERSRRIRTQSSDALEFDAARRQCAYVKITNQRLVLPQAPVGLCIPVDATVQEAGDRDGGA